MDKHKNDKLRRGYGKYLGDAVYGALDGIITTFAIVAGVAGASLSSSIVLVLGLANLLADGISMAAGNYLAKKSEASYRKQEKEHEYEEIEDNPEEERNEVRKIYHKKGFRGKMLSSIVKTITKDKDRWVDEMMVGELGMIESNSSPLKAGATTFVSFVVIGAVPLLSYAFAIKFVEIQPYSFSTACVLTFATIFLVGSARSILIAKKWWWAGLEMLLVGGGAAIVAYFVGYMLSGLV